MGGGFSRNKKRESVLDEVDWYIGSKGLPQPPKALPPPQHLANALLRSDSVKMQDESGDEITLLNCRPKFLEVMSGGKWHAHCQSQKSPDTRHPWADVVVVVVGRSYKTNDPPPLFWFAHLWFVPHSSFISTPPTLLSCRVQ
eukprot:TRINITY_DN3262_c0_g1_i1.p2 TRINITY_DN3262_c0_g1~~TRINITY_DN3262_c0_g1_i1.p2  ORF type:complete len:142 (+),score=16.69 TRINITY_DN3262_c0_g1_i1:178-603(+)